MDAGSTWFHRELEHRLGKLSDEREAYLRGGSAPDYANYRERVGYLRAIEDVLAICDEIAKEGSDVNRGQQAKVNSINQNTWSP